MITADLLRELFDSDLPDPQLVVVGGRGQVVPAGSPQEQGLVVASRADLLDRLGGAPPSGRALDDLAASLDAEVTTLGG